MALGFCSRSDHRCLKDKTNRIFGPRLAIGLPSIFPFHEEIEIQTNQNHILVHRGEGILMFHRTASSFASSSFEGLFIRRAKNFLAWRDASLFVDSDLRAWTAANLSRSKMGCYIRNSFGVRFAPKSLYRRHQSRT